MSRPYLVSVDQASGLNITFHRLQATQYGLKYDAWAQCHALVTPEPASSPRTLLMRIVVLARIILTKQSHKDKTALNRCRH